MMAFMLCEECWHVLAGWEEVFLLLWVEERSLQMEMGGLLWQEKPAKHVSAGLS